jgi:hypothetical protein
VFSHGFKFPISNLETFPILLSRVNDVVSEYPMKASFRSNREEELEKETNVCDRSERAMQRTTAVKRVVAFREDEKKKCIIRFSFSEGKKNRRK